MSAGDWIMVAMAASGSLIMGVLLGFALRDHLADVIARDWADERHLGEPH